MWNLQDDTDRPRPAEQLGDILERIQYVLLTAGAAAVYFGAVFLIAVMDGGSQSQGGRYYVAIGALLALGWIDSRFRWLARRRAVLDFCFLGVAYRRYLLRSALLMLVAAASLFGLAMFLP